LKSVNTLTLERNIGGLKYSDGLEMSISVTVRWSSDEDVE